MDIWQGCDPAESALSDRWRSDRAPSQIAHLDAAGAARASRATIEAEITHLERESSLGAYVAEAEAAPRLLLARSNLAELMGPGLNADDVTFHYSATTAFAALVTAWRLPTDAMIGVVPSEYGSNRLALAARAKGTRIELVDLPVDDAGTVDLDALDRSGITLTSTGRTIGMENLDLVTFPHVPSQLGTVQPATEIGARCAAAGVPFVLDVAQSLGQVDVRGIGATAYVGTSRKWLCGPRGAGFVAVRPDGLEALGTAIPSLYNASLAADGSVHPLPGLARLGIGETAVASTVGLAQALTELVEAGPQLVFARISRLAKHGRRILDGAGGWRVREDSATPSGIITLRPPQGSDPMTIRDLLYRDHQVLTNAIPQSRSRDLIGPVLRVSAHVYTNPTEFDRLAAALDRAQAAPTDRSRPPRTAPG